MIFSSKVAEDEFSLPLFEKVSHENVFYEFTLEISAISDTSFSQAATTNKEKCFLEKTKKPQRTIDCSPSEDG